MAKFRQIWPPCSTYNLKKYFVVFWPVIELIVSKTRTHFYVKCNQLSVLLTSVNTLSFATKPKCLNNLIFFMLVFKSYDLYVYTMLSLKPCKLRLFFPPHTTTTMVVVLCCAEEKKKFRPLSFWLSWTCDRFLIKV